MHIPLGALQHTPILKDVIYHELKLSSAIKKQSGGINFPRIFFPSRILYPLFMIIYFMLYNIICSVVLLRNVFVFVFCVIIVVLFLYFFSCICRLSCTLSHGRTALQNVLSLNEKSNQCPFEHALCECNNDTQTSYSK